MRRLRASLLTVAALLPAAAAISQDGAEAGDERVVVEASTFALMGVRVIDGTGRAPVPDQTIVVGDGRILSVGPTGAVTIPDGAKRIELSGHTVLPGLVMLHEHLMYSVDGEIWHAQPVSYPPLYLAAGVTTIRTAGTEAPFSDLNLKSRIEEGRVAGPKMHLTGPFFNGPAGDFLGEIRLRTPDEARRAVNYWADLGFTSFKVYTEITPDVLEAVIGAAHRRGLTVAGHLASVSCRQAAALGIDTIEHEFGSCEADLRENSERELSDPAVQELIRDLVDAGVVLVATPRDPTRRLSEEELDLLHPQARESFLRGVYGRNPPMLPRGAGSRLRAFVAAGGRIGIGSDPWGGGTIPGYSNQQALRLLVDVGWEPLEALRLATSNNAEILGVGDQVGRVAVGFAADLVVVAGDPSEEIEALANPAMVFKDGIGYSPERLRASVKGKVGWH